MNAPRASLPPSADPHTLYILDVSGYVFRAYYAVPPLSNSKGEPTHAVHGFVALLLKLLERQRPMYFAACMDSKKPSFRKDFYPEYKANRDAPPPDLSPQMVRCREIIEAYGIPLFEEGGMEADDWIAALTHKARAQGLGVVIVSADKDLLQLVGDGVVMYDSMREKTFGVTETVEKMGVPPNLVGDLLALMGDSSDNVPGVRGVGPKTAVKLLEQFGSLDGIYADLEKVSSASMREKLRTHKDEAYLSRRLVDLRHDLPVEVDLSKLVFGLPEDGKLTAILAELELHRLATQVKALGASFNAGRPAAAHLDTPPAALAGATPDVVAAPKKVVATPTVVRAPAMTFGTPGVVAPSGVTVEVSVDKAALAKMVADARGKKRLSVFCAYDGEDALFGELTGVALAVEPTRAVYFPIAQRYLGAGDSMAEADVFAALGPLVADKSVAVISPDAKGDAMTFTRHGFTVANAAFDACIASYVVDPGKRDHSVPVLLQAELGVAVPDFDTVTELVRGKRHALAEIETTRVSAYAGERAARLLALADKMEPELTKLGVSKLFHEMELPLAPVLARMEMTGVLLDAAHLAKMAEEVRAELVNLEKKCVELAGHEFNVNAPRQLEKILFDELGLPSTKKTKTARSTDAEVLEELSLIHELPKTILEHRSLQKLLSTYIEALPKEIRPSTGRVHTRFRQTVASTGRLSSYDPNLQNIPIRSTVGRKIREAFIAEPGWELLAADYSQIELRVLAHLSDDPALVDAFSQNDDVHARTAVALFGVDRAGVTRDMRAAAKTVNFAVIYGQTQFALAKNLGISRTEAARYIHAFFEQYAGVKQYMDRIVSEARETSVVHTMFGRRRVLADLQSKNHALRAAAERMTGNTPIQGTAADIMKLAMIHIDEGMQTAKMKARMILTVHDELVFEVPPDEKDALTEMVRSRMQSAATLKVPLVVDVGFGKTWGSAH